MTVSDEACRGCDVTVHLIRFTGDRVVRKQLIEWVSQLMESGNSCLINRDLSVS